MTILSEAIALADLDDECAAAAQIVSRCAASGMDPDSYRCVIGATVMLGSHTMTRAPKWSKDTEFVNALIDLECDLFSKLQQIISMINRCQGLLAAELSEKHPRKKVVDELRAALAILQPAQAKVTAALNRVMAAPDELEAVYAACYHHVRSGRTLPFNGRFLTGEFTA